jgi:hypothetical protein
VEEWDMRFLLVLPFLFSSAFAGEVEFTTEEVEGILRAERSNEALDEWMIATQLAKQLLETMNEKKEKGKCVGEE